MAILEDSLEDDVEAIPQEPLPLLVNDIPPFDELDM